MTHGARGVIYRIVRDEDFLSGVIKRGKGGEFTVISGRFNNTICDLDVIFLRAPRSDKVYLTLLIIIDFERIAHIDELIIHNVLEIMCEIVTAISDADGI